MFEKFGEYMYSLLLTAFKKGKKLVNQYYIFFKVVGVLYDDTKQDIFRLREESMVASASEIMLDEHGRDRDSPRLQGESVEGYRTRLSMYAIICEMGGTVPGIKLALAALGYTGSYTERMSLHDKERWAEFIVFLVGDGNGVTNLRVIDSEVMRVKQGSSMPVYAREVGSILTFQSSTSCGEAYIPRCNTLVCGVYPDIAAVGRQYFGELVYQAGVRAGSHAHPLTGTVRAAPTYYQEHVEAVGLEHGSIIGFGSSVTGQAADQEGGAP